MGLRASKTTELIFEECRFPTENLLEKLYRDQKIFDIFEGTGQIQRVVISRRIFQSMYVE